MLFDFPESFLVHILTHWIGVSEIARLDSACCERSIREQFWRILGSTSLVLSTPTLVLDNGSDLLWFARRKLKLRWMQLSDDMKPIVWIQFLKAVGGDHVHNVLILNMKHSTEPIFTIISVACSRIRRVCVRNCDKLTGLEMLLNVCQATIDSLFIDNDLDRVIGTDIHLPQLRRLHLNCNGSGGASLNKFLAASTCLEQVYSMDSAVESEHVDALWESRASLRELCLCHCMNLLDSWQGLVLCCRQLKQLMLQECTGVQDAEVLMLIRDCPSLDTLLLHCLSPMTDLTLHAIAENCGSLLQHLWLVNVRCRGDAGMRALTDCCTNIVTLGLLRIKGASVDALGAAHSCAE
jgi:hypothetical protein